MSLLSNLYNTVAKFFRPSEETGDASKSVATNRLKLVLMQDRTNLTPRILEQMRSELIELLSRYVELDKELLDLNFEQEGDQVALMLSIPVIRAKDEDEIDAAIKAHEEMLKAAAAKQAEENIEELENSEENGQTSEQNIASFIDNIDLNETNTTQKISKQQEEITDEEKVESDKTDAIVNELKEVPKIIKKKEKKEVSAPAGMNSTNNPFKSDTPELDMIESSSEL